MKKITRTIKISYRWWRDNKKAIIPEHVGALEESAEDKIFEMLEEGFSCGELRDNIHMLDKDPEDGIEYNGYWERIK